MSSTSMINVASPVCRPLKPASTSMAQSLKPTSTATESITVSTDSFSLSATLTVVGPPASETPPVGVPLRSVKLASSS